MTSGAPPRMNSRAPPRMTSGAPPRMTSGAPPHMTSGAPPRMTSGAPPRMTSGAPPRMTSGALCFRVVRSSHLSGTTLCAAPSKSYIQQIIINVFQYPHDVDVHLLFCFDLDLYLNCLYFVHVRQHAPPRIAGAGHLCYDRSLIKTIFEYIICYLYK